MGHHDLKPKALPFRLEGKFLGFQLEDGYKLKYLKLETIAGEQTIRLSKGCRSELGGMGVVLKLGDWLQISGEQSLRKSGEMRLEAWNITPIAQPASTQPTLQATERPAPPARGTASILVCQKSDCAKRGSQVICKALEQALAAENLADQVTVKGTGCMKQCKAGPVLVVMPSKMRYTRISPNEVPALVKRHFGAVEPAPAPSCPD